MAENWGKLLCKYFSKMLRVYVHTNTKHITQGVFFGTQFRGYPEYDRYTSLFESIKDNATFWKDFVACFTHNGKVKHDRVKVIYLDQWKY